MTGTILKYTGPFGSSSQSDWLESVHQDLPEQKILGQHFLTTKPDVLMDDAFQFVYALHLNAAILQEKQGILPRELMACVERIRQAFEPVLHGHHGQFVCPSPKHRKLLVSFVRMGNRVIIVDAKVIRPTSFYKKAA
ncbi:hypothetical protein EJV47_01265 [Hymenobacter gummosus]|uniref:Uncharacterized protein n=1 Tax=Hymenobacter gummosus TaxID=1776032 RepID=A0A3S0HA05_9BACT|nr:hypothetical protein [Hymenobacter gummosus]RTQ53400.1 hypothetical protein EJV47_01265 [Hymenobacter gummosus]